MEQLDRAFHERASRLVRRPKVSLRLVCTGLGVAALCYAVAFYGIARPVASYVVTPRPVALEVAGPGLLDATNKVIVTARLEAFLTSILVDRNDTTEVGEILARLDVEDLSAQLAARKADAEAATYAIAQAQAEKQDVAARAENARLDYDRKRRLASQGIVAQADWQAVETRLQQTQADTARAAASVARAVAQAASAAAAVKALQARIADAVIRSPMNGVVVMRYRNVGDLLSPGTPLLQLVDPRSLIVSARFDESAMGAIDVRQRASISFASEPKRPITGRILRLIKQVDQETREFAVDIALERLPDHWALGQRADVVVESTSADPILAIPKTFLTRRAGLVGVWRLDAGRAAWRALILGYPAGDRVEVRNGLRAGDVILDPRDTYWLEPVEPIDPPR